MSSTESALSMCEPFRQLAHYLRQIAANRDWLPSQAQLEQLGVVFSEENALYLAEFVNCFESDIVLVDAYIALYDAYICAQYQTWAAGGEFYDYSLLEIETFFDRVSESFRDLEEIHEASGNTDKFSISVALINHGKLQNGDRECTISIYTPSSAGNVLRDRFYVELPSAVLGAAIADAVASTLIYSLGPRPNIGLEFYTKTVQ